MLRGRARRRAARPPRPAIPGYELAGKTGTAKKVDADTGEYSDTRYVASFVGLRARPRPARCSSRVMVDEPQGAIYGGEVAAPAFQQIVAFALPYLRHRAELRRGLGPERCRDR